MPRHIALPLLAMVVVATPAQAADLPAHSRLGAVFAEPAESTVVADQHFDAAMVVVVPALAIRPLPGYYGRPNSFYYSPYYGSSFGDWAFRLPYTCKYYGYC